MTPIQPDKTTQPSKVLEQSSVASPQLIEVVSQWYITCFGINSLTEDGSYYVEAKAFVESLLTPKVSVSGMVGALGKKSRRKARKKDVNWKPCKGSK